MIFFPRTMGLNNINFKMLSLNAREIRSFDKRKIILNWFYFVLNVFFFTFDSQENSASKITWSCVICRAIKPINYAGSVRSSSFLNLGRDDNLSVIDNFTDLHTDLLNSSIIDIRSSASQRLLRMSSIRRSR